MGCILMSTLKEKYILKNCILFGYLVLQPFIQQMISGCYYAEICDLGIQNISFNRYF